MVSFHSALKALQDSGVKSQKHKRNENPLQIGRIQSAHAPGGQKTRSLPYSYTLTKSKSLNDGHSWRKYGQKKIFNAKFPRSYFRCPHKYDQGCKATRQVQQSEQDPSRFTVTYFGQHTCRDPFEVASSCIEEDPCTINFASPSEFDANFEQPQLSTLKQGDSCEDVVGNTATPGSSLSNCFKFPEFGLSEMLSLLA
ncbi:uncharacterized protein A4U43_C02F3800 [Asparagus officinalis]|uniref:WRKY domain-containing protein n=1 Tax=Asparagus officinalis TaxID=4686 RepID=A0A5P1FFN4_ASPOF|nr:probable WRKY transcription factor 70 [Asparagus officinalis]ONK77168.1 uncharacterized protein A4U43_C02F3800 [Asparagus officinalis]